MNLLLEINKAESLYRQKLEDYFKSVYKESILHSHGLGHHSMVWKYCRELITYPENKNLITCSSYPLKLLIASYLHDSGMSVDPGPRHGHLSRILCEQFLTTNSLAVNDFTDVLDAIENHDNKDYHGGRNDSVLLNFLTVADDLDALGYTGIYRYIEIYLKRGIKYGELGSRIKSNVRGRFSNMVERFGNIPSLITRERKRFEIISEFCSDYNKQLEGYKFGTGKPSGYCGIAEIITTFHEDEISGDSPGQKTHHFSNDEIITNFLSELEIELA